MVHYQVYQVLYPVCIRYRNDDITPRVASGLGSTYAELCMTTLVVQWGLNQHGEHAIHAPFVDALFTSDWLR